MTLKISYENFLPSDSIHISARTLFDAAIEFGKQVRSLTQLVFKEQSQKFPMRRTISTVQTMLDRTNRLLDNPIFVVGGTNRLASYLNMLSGFATGSEMSLVDIVFLQSVADISCQSIYVLDKRTGVANVVHIEENEADQRLVALHELLEKSHKNGSRNQLFADKKILQKLYQYRICHWQTNDCDAEFFAYPGLVGPGPAFGFNHKTQTLILADTLNDTKEIQLCSLWANALAFMLADIGNIQKAKRFFMNLKKDNIAIFGGYAIHMIDYGSAQGTFFCEYSGDHFSINKPTHSKSRVELAQTNYPKSALLQQSDIYNTPDECSLQYKQASLMVKRRTIQLTNTASLAMHPSDNTQEDIKQLRELIASPDGDIERFENGPVLAGFPNPYEAAYLVGSFSAIGGEICIGKLSPPPVADRQYQLFFTRSQLLQRQSQDLLGLTIDDLISGKIPLHVTIVYSTPTKRAIASGYGQSDEDTAYVAQKVANALKTKNIHTSLVAIDETTIKDIGSLKTDCVFNLIEWTGLDTHLSKKAFSYLRRLNIPVTGATEKNFCETTDKITAKKLFQRYNISTPLSQAFYTGKEAIDNTLCFPVIVKPSLEHGSIGLTANAIARTKSDLRTIIRTQIKTFAQPVLVETFVQGRELLVYLVEIKGSVIMLPIEEIQFDTNNSLVFQTYESKWDKTHKDYATTKVTRAQLTKNEYTKIELISRTTFQKLGFRGYARFDIRLKDGKPYVLEANANPNVYDSDEDQVPGISFPEYVWSIVISSLRSYQRGWKI